MENAIDATLMSVTASRVLTDICRRGGKPTPAAIQTLLDNRANPNANSHITHGCLTLQISPPDTGGRYVVEVKTLEIILTLVEISVHFVYRTRVKRR